MAGGWDPCRETDWRPVHPPWHTGWLVPVHVPAPAAGTTRRLHPSRGNHEEGHPPAVHGHPGDLYLRQHVHHAQHREQRLHPLRRVLAVPPVLHRQAEDPGHRWPRGPLREALRARRRRTRRSSCTGAPAPARAEAGALSVSGPLRVVEPVETPGGEACSRQSKGWWPSTASSSTGSRTRASTPTRGWPSGSTSGTPSCPRSCARTTTGAGSATTSRPPVSWPPRTRRSRRRPRPSRSAGPPPRSGCGTCWCRATPPTPRTRCWRSSPARAARSRRCSPATCCGCTPATPSGAAGRPSSSTPTSPTWAASSRSPSR